MFRSLTIPKTEKMAKNSIEIKIKCLNILKVNEKANECTKSSMQFDQWIKVDLTLNTQHRIIDTMLLHFRTELMIVKRKKKLQFFEWQTFERVNGAAENFQRTNAMRWYKNQINSWKIDVKSFGLHILFNKKISHIRNTYARLVHVPAIK